MHLLQDRLFANSMKRVSRVPDRISSQTQQIANHKTIIIHPKIAKPAPEVEMKAVMSV